MALSAVHRSLLIPELQHKVFENLAEDRKLGTLASAAGSCKILHDGAIRSLWREIPNLWIISNFFPDGCFKNLDKLDVWGSNPAFSTTGGISVIESPSDIPVGISRLAKYTPHVKVIHFDPNTPRWDYSALHVLCDKGLLPFPLFPNVERITLPLLFRRPFETILYPSFVISPSVRSITVLTDQVFNIHWSMFDSNDPLAREESQHSTSLVNRLIDMAPYATELVVESTDSEWYEFHTPTSALNSLFSRLPTTTAIRVLDITHLAAKGSHLKELSKLPALVELKISLRENTLDVVDAASTPSYFHTLVSVEIACISSTVTPCTQFFSYIRAPHLSNIKIHQDLRENTDLDDLFNAISQCTPPERVSSIIIDEVSYDDNAGGLNPHEFGLFTSFVPLFPFGNLKKLELSPFPVNINPRTLTKAFACWPKLEKLSLYYDRLGALTTSSLTLQDVLTAIQLCPQLSHLTLPVAATNVPIELVTPHHSLVSWNVCNSTITSGMAVGTWMKEAFPHLRQIQHFGFLRGCLEIVGKDVRHMARGIVESMPEEVAMIAQWNDAARIVRST